jgi:glycosyltransferase involved in cell wall biosynthesis
VITVHDLAIYRNPGWFPGRQLLSTRWVVPRSLQRADVIIAVSRSTARDLQELFGVPAARIEVVPHGVSAACRPMSGEDLAAARSRLRLPERFILFVGTIEPRKNLATLLEAWAMMSDRPDLVIVGEWGWLYESIRERIGRLGPAVHHLEGFGLPPLEAMACGTPVVVSDRASLPEVVGDAGLVVAADDPNAWRKALEKVIGDTELAADLRRRGILRAAEFSWARAADQTWRAVDRAIREAA